MGAYKYDVFISYSRKNQRWVNRLATDLKNHDINVWVDSLEISVGDSFRGKIEDGIKNSKYFCLIITNASMSSYYVRKLELEAAFSLMSAEERDLFILPIICGELKEPLPPMVSQYHYLDFCRRRKYNENIFRLVDKIRFDGYPFSGDKYYKNIDVSPQGVFVGVSEISGMSYSGHCARINFHKGKAQHVELFVDGELDCLKTIHYENGIVSEIQKYRNDKRVERLIYGYNKKGVREFKLAYGEGDYPLVKISYDESGKRVREEFYNKDGTPDTARGFSAREFIYNFREHTKVEVWRDCEGREIERRVLLE